MEARSQNQEDRRVIEPARSFRNLIVWQKAHQLVLQVYKYTKRFPKEETFGLTSQMRRASVSVAANIVEGFAKMSPRDKVRFMNISQGSLEECRYYTILAKDLGFGEDSELEDLADQTSRLLSKYVDSVKKDSRY